MTGLGRLLFLVVESTNGGRCILRPTSPRWLAWDGRALLVVTAVGGRRGAGPAPGHERFHGAAPSALVPVDVPRLGAGARRLGLVEGVAYSAAGLHSPAKGRGDWFHRFGDVGERGHGSTDPTAPSDYPRSLWPALWADDSGALVFRRRPGNRYTVADWIIG